MASDFSTALESSYSSDDFTCQLSDVLEELKGNDVNFELVKSQTVRPLRLFYVHNLASFLRAYIFVQTELKGFEKWGREYYDKEYKYICLTAKDYAGEVKQELEDKDALGIVEIEVFIDLSKEETIETFRRIKEDAAKFTLENNCKLGLIFSTIGFSLKDKD